MFALVAAVQPPPRLATPAESKDAVQPPLRLAAAPAESKDAPALQTHRLATAPAAAFGNLLQQQHLVPIPPPHSSEAKAAEAKIGL